mmetsp:Transcript_38275/g.126751  ORF Transcript_38275/g.126751 Transcript_38275/m.126751 type:complete len:201 (+) Transcript_38275:576-1178(+)
MTHAAQELKRRQYTSTWLVVLDLVGLSRDRGPVSQHSRERPAALRRSSADSSSRSSGGARRTASMSRCTAGSPSASMTLACSHRGGCPLRSPTAQATPSANSSRQPSAWLAASSAPNAAARRASGSSGSGSCRHSSATSSAAGEALDSAARVSRAQLARPRSPFASAASAASQSRAGSLCSALAESSVSRAKTSDAAAAS